MARVLLVMIHPAYKRGVVHVSLSCHAPLISDYCSASKYLLAYEYDVALLSGTVFKFNPTIKLTVV